jgi:dienelactone hydrolase
MLKRLALAAACLGLAASAPALAQSPEDVEGVWRGTLDVQVAQLRLELHVEAEGEALSAYMITVDQGGQRIPIESVSWDGETLRVDIPAIGASYEAGLSGPDTLDGTFTQRAPYPLELVRGGEAFAEIVVPPVPRVGRDEPAIVMNGDIALAGALRLPEGEGPFPAFVMLTGTGPQDRDDTIDGRPIFDAWASALAEQGIASLRLDDRGVAESGGDYATATSDDYASDAVAGLTWLNARAEIDAARTGYLGHSEGAVTAFLATQSSDPAFIYTLAGMTSKAEPLLYEQAEAIILGSGGNAIVVAQNRAIQSLIIDLAEGAEYGAVGEAIETGLLEAGVDAAAAETNRKAWGRDWFKRLLEIDTPALMAAYDGPVTAIYAEKDVQVVPGPQSAVAREALAGRDDAEILILEGQNHLFQDAETGLINEYNQIPQIVSPSAYEAIGAAAARLVERADGE